MKFNFDLDAIKSLGGAEYARQECWDISSAANALNMIAMMAMNEVDEPDDMQSLGNIMKSLMEFINGEIAEMVAASKRGLTEEKQEYAMMGNKITIPEGVTNATIDPDNKTISWGNGTNYYYGNVTFPEKKNKLVIENILDLSYVKSLHVEVPENKLAVKYVGKNTIAHPVFIWGDAKRTDLEVEFFNRQSDFWDESLKDAIRPLTWEHGQDAKFAEFEPNPVIGKTVKFYDDEIARWAESVITTDKQYRKYIDQFIEEKRLGYSSDSAPQYVLREKQGKATWLKMWPWFGGSLTASPCEPRMKVYTPEFLKSLGITLPDVIQERNESWTSDLAMLDYYKTIYHIGD